MTIGQHRYLTGNQWGMTVRDLIAKVAAEGYPVSLNWSEKVTDTGKRGSDYATGILPAITQSTSTPPTYAGQRECL